MAAESRGHRRGGARAHRRRVRGAAGRVRSRGGRAAGRAARPRRARPTNHTDLRYQFSHGDVDARLRRRPPPSWRVSTGCNFVTPACLGTMVAIADWDARGPAHDVVDDAGAVPLPARPRAGARHHAATASACMQPPVGGNFGRGPRPLPDRRDRRAAGPARAAAREDRVRAAGGVRRVPDPRAVHDPAAHRRRRRRPAARRATATWSSTTAPTCRGARPRRT